MHRLSARTIWYANEAAASFLGMLAFTVDRRLLRHRGRHEPPPARPRRDVDGGLRSSSSRCRRGSSPTFTRGGSRSSIGTFVMGVARDAVRRPRRRLADPRRERALGRSGTRSRAERLDAWLADEVGQERLAGIYLRGAQVGPLRGARRDRRERRCWRSSISGCPSSSAGVGDDAARGVPRARDARDRLLATPPRGARLVRPDGAHRRAGRPPRSRPPRAARDPRASRRSRGMWSEGLRPALAGALHRDIGLPSIGGLDPVVWFGIFGAGTILLSIAVAAPARQARRGMPGWRRWRGRCSGSTPRCFVSALVFGLAGQFWLALAALLSRSAWPGTWPSRSSRPGSTATSRSPASGRPCSRSRIRPTRSASGRAGPAIGLIGNVYWISAALGVGSLCMAPALALYRRAARHHGEVPDARDAPVRWRCERMRAAPTLIGWPG